MHVDLCAGLVRDGDAGTQLPAGVLQGDLDGDAVGSGGFHLAAAAGGLLASTGAGVPADDAVDGRGTGGRGWRIKVERWLGDGRRGGEIHARDIAVFAIGGADVRGVAFVIREDSDLLAAGERGDLAHGQ